MSPECNRHKLLPFTNSFRVDNFSRAHSLRSTLLQISREACSTSIIDLKSFVTKCGVEDQEETSLGLLFKQDIEDCHHDHGLGLFTKLQYSKFICPGDTSLLQEFYSVCGTQKFVESLQLSDVQYNSSNILQESGELIITLLLMSVYNNVLSSAISFMIIIQIHACSCYIYLATQWGFVGQFCILLVVYNALHCNHDIVQRHRN